MGIITRTILKGLDDLLHFSFVLALCFILYSMVGYIIFGPTIKVTPAQDLHGPPGFRARTTLV